MATRQYIGARYVPEFFNGTGGSPEWVSGVAYEALTIVTRLNNSYTSRKSVPSNIGAPESNPEYWVSTYIENSAVNPEDYGAVGDGSTDDYTAFVAALATGKPVIGNNDYYIGSQLTIPFNGYLECRGTVTAPNGIRFNNTDAVCKIKKLVGTGSNSGILFEVPPSDVNLGACARNNVEVGVIDGFAHGIDFYANINQRGIQYNRVKFDRIINVTNGIRMRTVGTRTWINQNQITGGSIYGGANDLVYTGVLGSAVVTTPGSDETEITSNKFENITFEGIEDAAIDLTNCTGNMFVDCRIAEEVHGTYYIKLNGSGANSFSGYLNFSLAKIHDVMATGWDWSYAYFRANRFDFFNLQSGTGTWHGKQGCWSFNGQFCYDYPTHGTYNVNTDNANYNFNTEFEFARYSIGDGFKISMQSGGDLTMPNMFGNYMTEFAVFNKGSGDMTVKNAGGTSIGTISGYGNHLCKWTPGGLLVVA